MTQEQQPGQEPGQEKYLEQFSLSARLTFAKFLRENQEKWDTTALFDDPPEEGEADTGDESGFEDLYEALEIFEKSGDKRPLLSFEDPEIAGVMTEDAENLAQSMWQAQFDLEDDHVVLDLLTEILGRIDPIYHLPILEYVKGQSEFGH